MCVWKIDRKLQQLIGKATGAQTLIEAMLQVLKYMEWRTALKEISELVGCSFQAAY